MTAEVKLVRRRVYQAFCDEHQDGVNSYKKVDADEWAETHNSEYHRDGKE